MGAHQSLNPCVEEFKDEQPLNTKGKYIQVGEFLGLEGENKKLSRDKLKHKKCERWNEKLGNLNLKSKKNCCKIVGWSIREKKKGSLKFKVL